MTKKILTLLFSVIIWVIPAYGQLSKNITVNTPGTLDSQLGADKTKVTDLVLTGTINDVDFATIKQMSSLKNIDMSTVNISNGTIPGGAFQGKVMTKITFPVNLKILGANAFAGSSFSELDFSKCLALEEIGYTCFAGLKTTTGILDFSKNTLLTRFIRLNLGIGPGTFTNYSGHVILPQNLLALPASIFLNFTGTIELPSALERIESSAFQGATLKTTLMLPSSLKIIGNGVFSGMSVPNLDFSRCQSLEELGSTCFAGLKTDTGILDFSKNTSLTRFIRINSGIGPGTFTNHSGHVILPQNLLTLPASIFLNFTGTIELPSALERIEGSAFQGATLKTTLMLPSSLKIISNGGFSGMSVPNLDFSRCQSLEELGSTCFAGLKTDTGILDFSKNTLLTRFIRTNSGIGPGTFTNHSGHVILPQNLLILPASTFLNFTGTIELPSGLERIEGSAFQGAILKDTLILSSSLDIIKNSAFQNTIAPALNFFSCVNLKNIGRNAFASCMVPELDFSQCISLKNFEVESFISSTSKVILPSNLINIPSGTFQNFRGSVIFPPVLETIGESAFANSVLTKGIVFPNSLKTIGTKAFYNSTIPSVSFEQMDPGQSGVSCF
ncbi:leucine-rich repeat domain-containing protein [Dysgonomonas sp. GY617]|uniref:leucine-rich repeat domain-containing protein n=1 Tax=Dysgonomonas sp. GY617 TaxID=2780420 RepID=UPI0018835223|nr:leucine-rich repeat domain-containing protein [Dysgonomonas sp. GY617]MBF0575562.1 leucine-rich repeat protein [Dysgonomonas sp. GY617]